MPRFFHTDTNFYRSMKTLERNMATPNTETVSAEKAAEMLLQNAAGSQVQVWNDDNSGFHIVVHKPPKVPNAETIAALNEDLSDQPGQTLEEFKKTVTAMAHEIRSEKQ